MLVDAAHNAFWSLNFSFLKWLAKEIGAEHEPGDSLFRLVFACVRKVLPKLTDGQVLDIVSLRLQAPDYLEDLVGEDLAECVHKADQQTFEQEIADREKRQLDQDDFVQEYKAKRLKHSSTSTEKAKKGFNNSSGNKYTSPYPAGDLASEQAQELAPPGWFVYSDRTNMRWQCYARGVATRSRAWVLYGPAEACRRVLAAAWDDYLLRQGLPREACPIDSLWKPAAA